MVDDAAILAATLEPPPDKLAVTHWSTRLLAGELGVGDATVARAWRRYGIKPWRRETFKFSTDPQFEDKLRRRRRAVPEPAAEGGRAVRGREVPDAGAWTAPQPSLPMRQGRAGQVTHDYKRNGTTTLFAALDVLTGKVIGAVPAPAPAQAEF